MSFDPTSVLNRIRSKKKMDRSRDSDCASPMHKSYLDGSVDYHERSRDQVTANNTLHIMAEQIRYMQDHIRRLEGELTSANQEITKLKEESTRLAMIPSKESSRKTPTRTKAEVFDRKRSEVSVSRSPIVSKQKSIDSTWRQERSCHELAQNTGSSYFGMYMSSQTNKTDESSSKQHYSTRNGHYSNKSELQSACHAELSDLRLDIIEKILSLDTKMAVPHVRIAF